MEMLRIKKENPNTTTLKIDVSIDVEKELKEYVKVGKHHKLMDKATTINDVVGVMLEKLLNDGEYLQLKQRYDKEMDLKRNKDRLRKQKEKEQKEIIKNQITIDEKLNTTNVKEKDTKPQPKPHKSNTTKK